MTQAHICNFSCGFIWLRGHNFVSFRPSAVVQLFLRIVTSQVMLRNIKETFTAAYQCNGISLKYLVQKLRYKNNPDFPHRGQINAPAPAPAPALALALAPPAPAPPIKVVGVLREQCDMLGKQKSKKDKIALSNLGIILSSSIPINTNHISRGLSE